MCVVGLVFGLYAGVVLPVVDLIVVCVCCCLVVFGVALGLLFSCLDALVYLTSGLDSLFLDVGVVC